MSRIAPVLAAPVALEAELERHEPAFPAANGSLLEGGSDVEQLRGGIVTPGSEWEGLISGPDIDDLGPSGTVALNFYDVVTATDTAGNPTQRTNFEWIVSYEKRTETKQDQIVVNTARLTQAHAAAKGYTGTVGQ